MKLGNQIEEEVKSVVTWIEEMDDQIRMELVMMQQVNQLTRLYVQEGLKMLCSAPQCDYLNVVQS
jgi:hypothetical protein